MAHRLDPKRATGWVTHDGKRLPAVPGEPLAVSLIAADRLQLGRSPKLHRPRGPSCLRGGCDGCLARVNGQPGVLTCLAPTRSGDAVETQNVVGSREIDALAAADFLFPRGIDHHRLFAGSRVLSPLLTGLARHVAGLGRLPDAIVGAPSAENASPDALVVGGGAAGIAAANTLADRGLVTWLVDDGVQFGGSLLARGKAAPALKSDVVACAQTTAVGAFVDHETASRKVVCVGSAGTKLLTPRAVVLATGCHDSVPLFPGNDLPGVMSARAALTAFHWGVAVADRLLLVGEGAFAERVNATTALEVVGRVTAAQVERIVGRRRVKGAVVDSNEKQQRLRIDAVMFDGPGAPCFELAVQCGAQVVFDGDGYVPARATDYRIAPDVYAAGSLVRAQASAGDGQAVAERVAVRLKR